MKKLKISDELLSQANLELPILSKSEVGIFGSALILNKIRARNFKKKLILNISFSSLLISTIVVYYFLENVFILDSRIVFIIYIISEATALMLWYRGLRRYKDLVGKENRKYLNIIDLTDEDIACIVGEVGLKLNAQILSREKFKRVYLMHYSWEKEVEELIIALSSEYEGTVGDLVETAENLLKD